MILTISHSAAVATAIGSTFECLMHPLDVRPTWGIIFMNIFLINQTHKSIMLIKCFNLLQLQLKLFFLFFFNFHLLQSLSSDLVPLVEHEVPDGIRRGGTAQVLQLWRFTQVSGLNLLQDWCKLVMRWPDDDEESMQLILAFKSFFFK